MDSCLASSGSNEGSWEGEGLSSSLAGMRRGAYDENFEAFDERIDFFTGAGAS